MLEFSTQFCLKKKLVQLFLASFWNPGKDRHSIHDIVDALEKGASKKKKKKKKKSFFISCSVLFCVWFLDEWVKWIMLVQIGITRSTGYKFLQYSFYFSSVGFRFRQTSSWQMCSNGAKILPGNISLFLCVSYKSFTLYCRISI